MKRELEKWNSRRPLQSYRESSIQSAHFARYFVKNRESDFIRKDSLLAATVTGLPFRWFTRVFCWVLLKGCFAGRCTEIVGFAPILRFDLRGFFVHFHFAYWVYSHFVFTSVCHVVLAVKFFEFEFGKLQQC